MNASRAACTASITAFFALSAAADAPMTDPNLVTQAIWKTQHMEFEFRGDRAYYSCSSIEEKLKRILVSVGAHADIHLHVDLCDRAIGVARFQVTLQSPVQATEENVHELTTYDARAQLAARVRGERLPSAEELPRFTAEWKTISFARDRKLRLAAGDCELVRQVRHQVLPKLSVVVLTDVTCSMMARTLSPPRLTVSALVAVPSIATD